MNGTSCPIASEAPARGLSRAGLVLFAMLFSGAPSLASAEDAPEPALVALFAGLRDAGTLGPDERPLFPPDLVVRHAAFEGGAWHVHLAGDLEGEGPLAEEIEALRFETLAGAFSASGLEHGLWVWIETPDGRWRRLGDLEATFDAPIAPAPPAATAPGEVAPAAPLDLGDIQAPSPAGTGLDPDLQGATHLWQLPLGGALEGVRIAISAGHGWLPDGSGGWRTQRLHWAFEGCGDCRGIIEDFMSGEIVTDYVIPLLHRMGAEVVVVREPDHDTRQYATLDIFDPGYEETGDWSDGASDGYYGRGYRVLGPGESGAATFSPPSLGTGLRRVQIRWLEGTNRIPAARVTITHAGGTSEVLVDQRDSGRGWIDLGQFWFEPGRASVTFSRAHDEGWLIADAVKFGGGVWTTSNKPWWEMGAVNYVPYAGAPGSVTARGDVTIRPTYAEYVSADYYVSIHANASGQAGGSMANGFETYRYSCQLYADFSSSDAATNCDDPPGSRAFIDTVHPAVLARLRADWDPTYADRTKRVANFGEVRELDGIPGLILELGFFDNLVTPTGRRMSDNQALHDPRFREAFAYGLADGLAAHVQAGASAPPPRPSGLWARNEPGGVMRVGFSPVDGAEGYVLYVAEGPHRGFLPRPMADGTEIVLDDLVPGEVYVFRVAAVDANGESLPSKAVAARFRGVTPEGEAPANALLVLGYDRRDAWVQDVDNRLDYAVELGEAFAGAGAGIVFDGAVHQVVAEGTVVLDDYDLLVYAAGKGVDADRAWTAGLRGQLHGFLDGGGALLLSGEDTAYLLSGGEATDATFLEQRLATNHVDRSGGDHVLLAVPGGPFADLDPTFVDDGRDGVYAVRHPNVIAPRSAGTVVLEYPEGLGAAVATAGTMLLAVPLETVVPAESRAALLRRAVAFLVPDLLLDGPPPPDDPPDDDPPDDDPPDDDPPGDPDDPPGGNGDPGDDPGEGGGGGGLNIRGGCGCAATGGSGGASIVLALLFAGAMLRPRRRQAAGGGGPRCGADFVRPSVRMKWVALFASTLFLAGCMPTLSTLQRPQITATGETDFAFGAGAIHVFDPAGERASATAGALDVGVRQGIGENLDVGGRLWPLALTGTFDLKYRFLRTHRMEASVIPGVGATMSIHRNIMPIFRSHHPFQLQFYGLALVGIHAGEHQLLLAPKINTYLDQSAFQVLPGAMVGFDVSLGEHGRLIPEINGHCNLTRDTCIVVASVGMFY
jgi:MYXO-CTERM domain-containing protein